MDKQKQEGSAPKNKSRRFSWYFLYCIFGATLIIAVPLNVIDRKALEDANCPEGIRSMWWVINAIIAQYRVLYIFLPMFALYCLWVWWYQICDFFKLTLKKSKELILEERLTETRISPNGNAAEDEIPQNENERKKWIQDVLTEVPARILHRLCICEPEYYAGIQGEQIVAFFVERNPLERLFVPNFDQKNVECFSSDSEEIRKTVELLLRYRFVEQFTFFGRQSNRDYYRLTVLGREISFEVERPA